MEIPTAWKQKLARQANRLVLGRHDDCDDALQSWFGRVTVGEPGERWPTANGLAMWPLLQIVVRELPFVPAAIRDVALIRVFVNPAFLAITDNGGADFYEPAGVTGPAWILRTSTSLDHVERMAAPDHGSRIIAAPGHWQLILEDYPAFEDLPPDFPEALADEYSDCGMYDPHDGTKVGGWPRTIQSEVYWAPGNAHCTEPEYVFQVDSDYQRRWMWGDSGVAYFGRGTGRYRDEWAMEWQGM